MEYPDKLAAVEYENGGALLYKYTMIMRIAGV